MKKKLLLVVLALCLLLSACAKNREDVSAAALAERLKENLSAKGVLLQADDDFFLLGFPDAPAPAERAVFYSGAAPTTEYGVFRMENEKDAAEMERAVRMYLDTEKESRTSIARLYPTEDSSEDCARFENALLGRRGKIVFYFVGDEADITIAENILES